MDLTNRMLRISVHGTDMILRKDVADIQLSLYDIAADRVLGMGRGKNVHQLKRRQLLCASGR